MQWEEECQTQGWCYSNRRVEGTIGAVPGSTCARFAKPLPILRSLRVQVMKGFAIAGYLKTQESDVATSRFN